jgi:hypothetical protein
MGLAAGNLKGLVLGRMKHTRPAVDIVADEDMPPVKTYAPAM